MYANDDSGPPCRECVPDVMEANREAVQVWAECRTQVIAGFNGIIDINLLTVKMVMDLFGIKSQRDCMERVRVMFDEYRMALEENQENAKPQN